ncbi:gamma-glutamyl-gamma-aminobutyrate hydrolase family protein [Olivibacter sp. SDN3]|nr:gamma-glutamyl-gamma-aminobutyrate hydrolase family protein [Olivibacter sp. SDN3]
MQEKLIIGMTDGRMYELYAQWIKGLDLSVEIVRLGYALDNLHEVAKCRGLVFTGGEDVYPKHYGKEGYLSYCEACDFDEQRDDFELKLLTQAHEKQLPILGVCRGLQLINIFYGGTLIPDLPVWGKFNHSRLPNGKLPYHEIQINENSLLYEITGAKSGMVNSLHHQSANRIGRGLLVSALSADGVVEAIERVDPTNGPFLCLVQWHPERMEDMESVFVKNIGEAFIGAVRLM